MAHALRKDKAETETPELQGVSPACLVMPRGSQGDPALLDARWTIRSEEPFALLSELLGDSARDSRRMSFAGSAVLVSTTRRPDGSLSFSVASGSASLCKARLFRDGYGNTDVVLTYRRGHGRRLLTTPEGVVLLEVLMGYVLEDE